MVIKNVFYTRLLTILLSLALLFYGVWLSTFHPSALQTETVHCPANTPSLQAGQSIKLYNQNVQFMAGKNYVFFYDLPNNSGPDERPSASDIKQTLQSLASLIRQQDPDIILLQEVDDGAKRTDYNDQLAQLLSLLPSDYACHASSIYWQAKYLPHPRIMGAVGMKLSIISKYKINSATRHQLALIPQDPVSQLFNFKRAMLDVRLPVNGAAELAVLTTHLSAFAKGSNTLPQQIKQIDQHLQSLKQAETPWVIGGDFNLLPPDTYYLLAESQREPHEEKSAITTLYRNYPAIPNYKQTQSSTRANWFSYNPNDPRVNTADRTIDYYFYSPKLSLQHAFIENKKFTALSDHLPMIATFLIPKL